MIRHNDYTPHKGRLAVTLTAYRPWQYGLPSFFPAQPFKYRGRHGMSGDVRFRYISRSLVMGIDYLMLRLNDFFRREK